MQKSHDKKCVGRERTGCGVICRRNNTQEVTEMEMNSTDPRTSRRLVQLRPAITGPFQITLNFIDHNTTKMNEKLLKGW